jgi:hypothetical protein
MKSYAERQCPITIPHDLVRDLWSFVKCERDNALDTVQRLAELESLLDRMKVAGMSDHLATLDEVRAAWREEAEEI